MIGIVWSMVRARWARAVAVCLIAAATVAVAVAWPAYLSRADAAMIATEISHASAAEVTLSMRSDDPSYVGMSPPRSAGTTTPPVADTEFAPTAIKQVTAPWFTAIYATDIDVDTDSVAPGGSTKATIPEVVFRQNYCSHVVITAGRCPLALREVLLDTGLAARLQVHVGDALPIHGVLLGADGWQPVGAFVVVSVVGIYRVPDENDPYWGTEAYFSTASGNRGNVLPILAEPGTIDVIPHPDRRESVDGQVRPGGLTTATLPSVRAQVASFSRSNGTSSVTTSIPTLLGRIDADRATLRQVVPGLVVPLLAIGCLALFLAVAHAVAGRRPEIAVIGLRGMAMADRWWIAMAESLVGVAIAVPVGLALGDPLARATAALTLHGVASDSVAAPTDRSVVWIIVGLLVLATVAAHVRPLAATVTDLLRRIPDRRRAWRTVPLQAAIVVVAAAAIVQLRAQTGPPAGLTLIAPALFVTAIAVLLGQFVSPVAARVGRRTIGFEPSTRRHRVRLGLGLGAIALARRPGAQRLLVVEAVAIGLVGLTFATSVAAARERAAFARVDVGAARVLTLGSATPAHLLSAVDAADPSGRYAMAVMQIPAIRTSDPPLVAVDTSRLAAVANWPPGSNVAAVVAALRAAGPAPTVVAARSLRIDASVQWSSSASIQIGLTGLLAPTDGRPAVNADFGVLNPGRHGYVAQVPDCLTGCRIVGLIATPQTDLTAPLSITVHSLIASHRGPGSADEPGAATGDATVPITALNAWRLVNTAPGVTPAELSSDPSGLTVSVSAADDYASGIAFAPITGPYPLPVVAAGSRSPDAVLGVDSSLISVRVAMTAPKLPRVAGRGALVDLDDLALSALRPDSFLPAEVWLAPHTPSTVVAALTSSGLDVVSDRTEASERAYLGAQGPAVGVALALAAAIGLVAFALACLVLMFAVERSDRSAELAALRVQGVGASAARRSLIVGQAGLVCAAAVIGLAAAAAAWLVTIDRLPIFVAGQAGLSAGRLPIWSLAGGVVFGAAVLAAVAVCGALSIARRLRGAR